MSQGGLSSVPGEDQVEFVDDLPERKPVPIWVWFAITNVIILAAGGTIVAVILNSQPAARDNDDRIADNSRDASDDATPPRPIVAPQRTIGNPMTISPEGSQTFGSVAPQRDTIEADDDDEDFGMAGIIQAIDDSIVLISTFDEEGRDLGLGSGFVIDAGGMIATNYHVIDGASSAQATFRDGLSVDIAGCTARDELRDLAILQLAAHERELIALPLYEGADIAQGEDVIAVGHPQGFRFVTTTGIVSAIHRQDELPEESQMYVIAPDDNTWIQTTAAISGGNSGGPLLDSDGYVIGINTWVAWGENMGFAGHVKHLVELRESSSGEVVSLAVLAEPSVRYNELLEEYASRQHWYEERLLQAETDAEREEILRTDPALEFADSMIALSNEFPQSSIRFSCLSGAITMLGASESPRAGEIVERAGEQLLLEFVDHPGIQDVVLTLARSGAPIHYDFLHKLELAATDRTLQALACYTQGVCLMNAADAAPDAGIAEWERLIVDYPDVEYMGQRLSMLVEHQLYEHRYFGIGRVAPDIVGRDADGVEFKLSDYRGQVVVLDFWADWCPHCVNMYPVERELLETYAGRPFVIVGVNGDSAERMHELAESGKVTWRSFDDGSFGPITEQYHITGIPAIFVLDAEGVIRYKDVRGDELVAAVAELMSEMPAAAEEEPIPEAPSLPEEPMDHPTPMKPEGE